MSEASDSDARRWWQTLPGMLTAAAGLITAVTGLVVAITQLTGGSGGSGTVAAQQVVSAGGTPTTTAQALPAGGSGAYRVAFPDGTKATLDGAVYQVLSAKAEQRNPGELGLTLTVRMTNTGSYPENFWDRTFRLQVDGVPTAPVDGLDEVVDARAAKEGDVVFVIPDSARTATLVIGDQAPVRLGVALSR